MKPTFEEAAAQLFLHAALRNKSFEDYIQKQLLVEKLNALSVDFEEQFTIYYQSIAADYSTFSLVSNHTASIPVEKRYGIYCQCIQLGIVNILDNPSDDFFVFLRISLGISIDEETLIKKVFSEMLLLFI